METIAPIIQPSELEILMNTRADIRLIDVRTTAEFDSAHIPAAYNVPVEVLPEHAREIAQDTSTNYVLICQSGARARKAEEALRRAGLTRLHVLDGGMNAWLSANKPARFGPRRMSLERQVRIAAGTLAAIGGVLALTMNAWFALIPSFVGGGLMFAGITDTCGMAMLLSRLPYNSTVSCDVSAMVQALKTGAAPIALMRGRVVAQSCAR